jgi:hypothetical protein
MVPERLRPIGYLTHLTRKKTSCRVRSGPFSGMRYVTGSVGSAYLPKLLGIYERELSVHLEGMCGKPDLIVNVGAAKGYYAVGLALRNPQARVIAFEAEEKGRLALTEMAHLNGVSGQIEIRCWCAPVDLQAALAGSRLPLLICDVEGYEETLLDVQAVPALERATILTELHEFVIPGISALLIERFEKTHKIERIWQQPRTRQDFPWRTLGTVLLPKSYLDWAVSEWRPERMSWLWMMPR